MADDIVERILALDARAEETVARAREEAADTNYKTAARVGKLKDEFEGRKVELVAEVESRAAGERSKELAALRKVMAAEAEGARHVSPEAFQKAADIVAAKAMRPLE